MHADSPKPDAALWREDLPANRIYHDLETTEVG